MQDNTYNIRKMLKESSKIRNMPEIQFKTSLINVQKKKYC